MALVVVLALASAALHASWNLLLKSAPGSRRTVCSGQFFVGALLALPVCIALGGPGWIALPYLLASGAIEVVYTRCLARAYTVADFSLAYPLARGGGALAASLGAAVLLGDRLTPIQWVGIAVVGIGLWSFAGPRLGKTGVVPSLLTACTIAAYTLVDVAGVRATGDGLRYGLAQSVAAGTCITLANVASGQLPALVESARTQWRYWVFGGAGMVSSYTLALVAFGLPGAAVGTVAVLRESSVVLGAALGWLLLGERLGRMRFASSLVVLLGLAITVAVRTPV